jgi:predicted TIM-barrel fold metal-dependent hydrolase
MHDPKQADQELRRCVQEPGFDDALLCDSSAPAQQRDLPILRLARLRRVLERPHRARCQLVHPNLYISPAAPSDVILDEL